jgi:hypothetical protein
MKQAKKRCEAAALLAVALRTRWSGGIGHGKGRPVSMIVKAKGPSGPATIHSDDPKHALGLVQYLRTIGYKAWIEDANGNEIEETVLKNAIK